MWSAQVASGYILSSVAKIFLRRACLSAAVFGFGGRNTIPGLVKIDISLGRRLVRMLLGDLEHFVEFLA